VSLLHKVADDAEHVVFDARFGQNVKVADGSGVSLIDSEKRIRDLHHARVPVSMLLEALQTVCGLCTDTTMAHAEVLKHAVNQLLKYTDAIEQIIREYRIRHVKKCTPVGELLKKQRDDKRVMEIVHRWFESAQRYTWKKRFNEERITRIREAAQRKKHINDIFIGRTSRNMSNTKLRKVIAEWKGLAKDSYFQRMFINHLIKVREDVALNGSITKIFYLFKEKCAKLKHEREAAAAAARIEALESELAFTQTAWVEDRNRVAHREHQLTACTSQWWRSEVLRGGWSAATCKNFLANLEGPSSTEDEHPIAYAPARTPFSPMLQAGQAVQ